MTPKVLVSVTTDDVESRGVRENEFSCMHVEFEMPVGYPSGDAHCAVSYVDLRLKRQVRDDQKNMKVVCMLVVVKIMAGDSYVL